MSRSPRERLALPSRHKSCAYYFFAGVETVGVEFVQEHYGIGQALPVARGHRVGLVQRPLVNRSSNQFGPPGFGACFFAGANSIFYGEQLLTTGNPEVERDRALLDKLGMHPFSIQR